MADFVKAEEERGFVEIDLVQVGHLDDTLSCMDACFNTVCDILFSRPPFLQAGANGSDLTIRRDFNRIDGTTSFKVNGTPTVFPSVFLFFSLRGRLTTTLSFYPSLSIYLFVCLFVCPLLYVPNCRSICLPVVHVFGVVIPKG